MLNTKRRNSQNGTEYNKNGNRRNEMELGRNRWKQENWGGIGGKGGNRWNTTEREVTL